MAKNETSLSQCILDYLAESNAAFPASAISAKLKSVPDATRGQIVMALSRLYAEGKIDRYSRNGRYNYWRKSSVEQPATPPKRWPFVESPGEFTDRLQIAMQEFPLIGAVRHVLIENPPTLIDGTELPDDSEVMVKKQDANNYCLILSALGMQEEGDPVAEVKRLRGLVCGVCDGPNKYDPEGGVCARCQDVETSEPAARIPMKDLALLQLIVSPAPELDDDNPDVRPTFDELQKWALANGRTGQTEQQCFDAWLAARSTALVRKWRDRYNKLTRTLEQPPGDVVVTKVDGVIGAVTRQDGESRILSIIAESDLSAIPHRYKDPNGFTAKGVLDEALNWTSRATGKQMLLNYAAFLESQTTKE